MSSAFSGNASVQGIDLGGEKAGHPTNKAAFAKRLSTLALHDVYHILMEEWTGPLFRSTEREGEKMVITFDHAAGLKPSIGDITGVALAGSDQKFVWAQAEITDGKLIVWSDAIKESVAVRYAWAANPKGNLINAGGLPTSPFRTDDWK